MATGGLMSSDFARALRDSGYTREGYVRGSIYMERDVYV
jgi:hypothetical protein